MLYIFILNKACSILFYVTVISYILHSHTFVLCASIYLNYISLSDVDITCISIKSIETNVEKYSF